MSTEAIQIFQDNFDRFVGNKPFIDRKELSLISGLTIGSLANMDCKKDIPGRIKTRNKNLYEISKIKNWLVSRIIN